jgi:HEAT repeat protein
MISRARNIAIQGLVAGTLALLSYLPDAAASAAGGFDPFVEAVVAEVESADHELPDRQGVLRRLALSPQSSIRMRVAEAAGALASEDPEAGLALLRLLSHDSESKVRAAAARGLGLFLEHASGPLRCAVESGWATAALADERVALARALGASSPGWMTDLALMQLASDARVPVRRAALHSVRAQLRRNPEAYLPLVAARSADPDRGVRKSARRALCSEEARSLDPSYQPSPTALRESRKRFQRALRQSMRASDHPRAYGIGVLDAEGRVLLMG